jgi:hypothetical protein
MAFEESQSWDTLVTEVCVAFDTVLNRMADATIKKRKLYRIYRSGARLGVLIPAGGYTERGKR